MLDDPSKRPRWFWPFVAVVLILSSLPAVFGILNTPSDSQYLGVQWNIDDHAVYAAWMKQAQEGRLLFENRFTTDDQPGLTIHLYFLLTGWLSKLTGISLAMHIGRIVFSALAMMALFRLISRVAKPGMEQFLTMSLAVFGGGVGWAAWKRYGQDSPIDVWQAEAFVFPSLLTNGLFAVSLWLMLVVLNKMADAKDSWKPVLPAAIALLALTNIHTYDTLLIALVSAGWLASCIASKTATVAWIGRCSLIAFGALPAVAWFVYVRSVDPVFLERANTPTPAAPPLNMFLGVLPLIVLALWGLTARKELNDGVRPWKALILFTLMICAVFVLCSQWRTTNPYSVVPFAVCFALSIGACSFFVTRNVVLSLLFAWIAVALVAPYYPGLFQRKLGMMIALPFGVLAAFAVSAILTKVSSQSIKTAAALGITIVLSLSSIKWMQREFDMIRDDISNTTMHRVYLSKDASEILRIVRERNSKNTVILAQPGAAIRIDDTSFQVILPDLNPILTGWGGAKSYAGHWSETPHYSDRRTELLQNVFNPATATPETIRNMVMKTSASLIVLPISVELTDFVVPYSLFQTIPHRVTYRGDELMLIEIE
jgi:arabinosyltransferase C